MPLDENSFIPSTPLSELTTRQGHQLDKAASAFQKAVRRSHLDDCLYWACEMADRYPAYCWRRIRVIVSEDIGIAEPNLPATIRALHETWSAERNEKRGDGLLYLIHAVILLAKARKSRMVDNALYVHTADPEYRDPPDYALDMHTKHGREMGRDLGHFWTEGALLGDPETGEVTVEGSIPDPYAERARRITD
ncbi:MAG: hypothetical protein ABI726_05055 [bacterium]